MPPSLPFGLRCLMIFLRYFTETARATSPRQKRMMVLSVFMIMNFIYRHILLILLK